MNIKKPDLKKSSSIKEKVHLAKTKHSEYESNGQNATVEEQKAEVQRVKAGTQRVKAGEQEVRQEVKKKEQKASRRKIRKTDESGKINVRVKNAGRKIVMDYKDKKESKEAAAKKESGRKERDFGTSSHTAKRLDAQKQQVRKKRQAARKKEVFRMCLIIVGAIAALILVLVLAGNLLKGCSKPKHKESAATASSQDETAPKAVSADQVRHLSFRVLLHDGMAGDNSVLTINQFRQILQQLYDANYILVDFYSIADQEKSEEGEAAFKAAKLDIPEGKIPFVLSQRDVSYSLDRVGKGYASRLVVMEDGRVMNEYQNLDGSISGGAYDVVPILEEFIAGHPDFSYNGARGVLGLTGYNGILGYRTSEILGRSHEEGNPYAAYGTFDVNAEREASRAVVDALKRDGWHFASYGYNYCSYGSEYQMVTADMDTWMSNVSDLVGGTDILIYPCETDIGYWSEYKDNNPKYQYLKDHGFKYYCIEDQVNPSWLQVRDAYVRQGIKEIDCYEDFEKIMAADAD